MIGFPENANKKEYISTMLYNQAFRKGAAKAINDFGDAYTGDNPEQVYAVSNAGHTEAKKYISDIKKTVRNSMAAY